MRSGLFSIRAYAVGRRTREAGIRVRSPATTLYAGWLNIFDNFLPRISAPGQRALGIVNVTLTVVIMLCSVVILVESARRAYRVLVKGQYTIQGKPVSASDPGFPPAEFGEA